MICSTGIWLYRIDINLNYVFFYLVWYQALLYISSAPYTLSFFTRHRIDRQFIGFTVVAFWERSSATFISRVNHHRLGKFTALGLRNHSRITAISRFVRIERNVGI